RLYHVPKYAPALRSKYRTDDAPSRLAPEERPMDNIRRKPSTRRWVIVEKRLPPAAKGSEPLHRIMPMQHGFERLLSFVRVNSGVNLGPAVFPHPADNHTPLRRPS